MPPSESRNKFATWARLNALDRVLDGAGVIFEPLTSAISAVSRCVDIYEIASKNREEYATLKADLESQFEDLAQYFHSPIPPSMTSSIENLARSITRETERIEQNAIKTTLGQYAKAKKKEDDIIESYRRIHVLLGRLAQNANLKIWTIVDDQATEHRLRDLNPSRAAWYSSAESTTLRRNGCTQKTRMGVLSQLMGWSCDEQDAKIYWLNGMAGTGKTTIAYTLSDELHKEQKLAASFFCSRQLPSCRDVNLILPSISYQLARFSRPFRCALSAILEKDPDVHTRQLSEQFEQLVASPLRQVQKTMPTDLVVVIDGLDECERRDGVDIILDALLSRVSSLPIKFFVSSRPEPNIITRIHNRSNKTTPLQLRLHELEHSVVSEDIKTYLSSKLGYMDLSPADVQRLTAQSGVLFIYAVTAARYIEAGGPARSALRLKEVLSAPTLSVSDEDNTMDSLYHAILSAAFDDKKLKDKDRDEMMLVLSTAICAQEPLTSAVIARLLRMDSDDLVHAALDPLLSVLSISPSNKVVSTLHASFPDYLFDRDHSGRFYCDVRAHNTRLALSCFDLIKVPQPPFNICRLESSFVLDNDVPDLSVKIKNAISEDLFYSCRYFGFHLLLAEVSNGLTDTLLEFFTNRFLFWMEVMNLKESMRHGAAGSSAKMDRGRSMSCNCVMQCLKRPRDDSVPPNVKKLTVDASRFLRAFLASPVSQSTPHIYVSALAFWPAKRAISRHYLKMMAGLTRITGTAVGQRDSALVTSWSSASYIYSMSCSPKGTQIACGCGDGMLRIRDAQTGQIIGKPLEGHTAAISSLSYSPDGAYIASGSIDNTIRIWDAQTSRVVGESFHGSGLITSISYSPDGAYIASGSFTGAIRILDIRAEQSLFKLLDCHTNSVNSIAFSPDGACIAFGSDDTTIRIWDAKTGQVVGNPLEGHTSDVNSVSYSPDGAYIVSGSRDKTIRVWDAKTGQMVGKPLEGHTDAVNSTLYSPDGVYILSGSDDKTIRIWDARTGQIVGEPLESSASVTSVSFPPDGAYIASSSYDGNIRIWDIKCGQMVCKLLEGYADSVNSLVCSRDGAYTFPGSYYNTIRVRETHIDSMVEKPHGHCDSVTSISCSPDGAFIVSGSEDYTIRIWEAHSGQMVGRPLEGHTNVVNSVSYSPDGAHIVSGCRDRTIWIWDARTGETIGKPLKRHRNSVDSVSYSPDGAYIVSGSWDGTSRIWNAPTGQMIVRPPKRYTSSSQTTVYSPDGSLIISGGRHGIQVCDLKNGQMVEKPLQDHAHRAKSVSYSPDGAYIASGSYDYTIRIWDAQTGRMIGKPLEGHCSAVNSVAFSPDSAYVVSGSADKTIRVWDVKTGQLVGQPIEGHTGSVRSVAYSPDGAFIVSGAEDRSIRIWDIRSACATHGALTCSSTQTKQSPKACFLNKNDGATNTSPSTSDWTINDQGWIVSAHGDLRVWVPIDLRTALVTPHTVRVISRRGMLRLDFSDAFIGPSWHRCFQPAIAEPEVDSPRWMFAILMVPITFMALVFVSV